MNKTEHQCCGCGCEDGNHAQECTIYYNMGYGKRIEKREIEMEVYIILWGNGFFGIFDKETYEQKSNSHIKQFEQIISMENIKKAIFINHAELNELRNKACIAMKPTINKYFQIN